MYYEIKLMCGVRIYLYATSTIAVMRKFWEWGYTPDDLVTIRPLNFIGSAEDEKERQPA